MKEEPQKSALRRYQDQAANAGWRMRLIPYDDPRKPMRIQTNRYAMAGAVAFCIGFCGLWTGGLERIRVSRTFYFAALVGGWCFALASIFLAGRGRTRGWVRLKAVCLDRECRSDGEGWGFRLRCRLELQGKAYTVTPAPFWRSFASEDAVGQFLAKAIAEDGTCWLRVNPRNPLQTELATGLADKLLFRK